MKVNGTLTGVNRRRLLGWQLKKKEEEERFVIIKHYRPRVHAIFSAHAPQDVSACGSGREGHLGLHSICVNPSCSQDSSYYFHPKRSRSEPHWLKAAGMRLLMNNS